MTQASQQKIIVSGILSSPKGVLLARRPLTKKIAPGVYHLPGGHVEFGEDPESALIREFAEEFNLQINIIDIVRSFSYTIGQTHTVGMTFLVTAPELPDEINYDQTETDHIEWVTADTVSGFLDTDDHDRITLEKYFLEKTA